MRTLELIRQLDEREFVLLCSVLLKEEISPRVRLVSVAGSDGGRDGWFDGTSISYPGWDGAWLFQFKHYRYDTRGAQRRILQDLERGVPEARAAYPQLRNYVLITSVPFTGTPGYGLYDKVAAAIDRLQLNSGLRVDVWDGLEVSSQVALHSAARALIHTLDETVNVPDRNLDRFRLAPSRLRELSDDALLRYSTLLISSPTDPLGPNAVSPVAEALYQGHFPTVRDVIAPVLAEASRRRGGRLPSPELLYWTKWLTLAVAMAEVRTGAVRAAVRRTRALLPELDQADELAWAFNVLSLAYGKLEEEPKYEAATLEAVNQSLRAGNHWLAVTIAMRTAHKSDWAAGEAGSPIPDGQFRDMLHHAVADASDDQLSDRQAAHLRGQQQAYLALHLRWNDDMGDEARDALKSAGGYFRVARDESELTRIEAEDGQLLRMTGLATDTALMRLQSALRRRLASGELSRARYDLLWLAETHAERGGTVEAEMCGWLGLAFHRGLFGTRDVDSRVVQKTRRLLSATDLVLRRRSSEGRLTDDLILDVAATATGLSEMDVLRYVDTRTVRNEVMSTDLL